VDFNRFDTIIDARTPSEYALDHIPGAVSAPVLDDAQRAEVGTLYKQVSPFEAKKLGAALLAKNVSRHVETLFAGKGKDWRPLVYCWRGGKRSGAMAHILREIGWNAQTLEGGYRAYRRWVVDQMTSAPLEFNFVVVHGPTGSGKSRLLSAFAHAGAQVLDLEALAAHRGSLFGAMPGGQPSQKAFESRLHDALSRLDTDRPVLVEAESSKIGARVIPPSLWAAMTAAPVARLGSPVAVRAARTLRDYAAIAADPAALDVALTRLPRHISKETVSAWRALAAAGEIEALATELIVHHYDPAYRRQGLARRRTELVAVEIASLADAALEQAADQLVGRLAAR
jgi:tRNA 2-selenouridine synthase